jgi:hypothetical protein
MALFRECMRWCAYIVLDFADIVREGDFSPLDKGRNWTTTLSPAARYMVKPVCTASCRDRHHRQRVVVAVKRGRVSFPE